MKDKRPKDSIFYDSIKNDGRKQGEKINFYRKNENSDTESMSFSNQNMTNNKGMNDFFSSPDHGTGNNASTRDAAALFMDIDSGVGSDYTYKKGGLGSGHTYNKEEQCTYLYGFTNSKFIYFLGTMEPRAYLVFVALIALLILEDLNKTESKIIYAFISNVAYSMQSVVEQEIILDSYTLKKAESEKCAALQKDFETIYTEINRLKKEMSHLKS